MGERSAIRRSCPLDEADRGPETLRCVAAEGMDRAGLTARVGTRFGEDDVPDLAPALVLGRAVVFALTMVPLELGATITTWGVACKVTGGYLASGSAWMNAV